MIRLMFQFTTGTGLWKFNNCMLKDLEFVELISNTIQEQKDMYVNLDDKSLKWDVIKCEIRRVTIMYSKKHARETREELVSLTRQVTELEKRLAESPTDDTAQQYQCVKEELDSLL